MTPSTVIKYIPSSLKTHLLDKIVETIAEQAEKFNPDIAKHIRKLSSKAAFQESCEKALESGVKRFVDEYLQQDEDIVIAIQNDSTFWESKLVQEALIALIKRPGAYLVDEHEMITQHFEDVLPQRINRERVDKAIIYFLRCLAEELWTLPGAKEIRDIYSLQFQRISAEAAREQVALSRKQLQTMAMLGEEVQRALVQFTEVAEQHFLTSGTISDELPLPRPYQNLIAKNYTNFVGREEEINKLLRFLSPDYGLNIITIDGIGGVGKTSLVLEVAYQCLEASKEENMEKSTNTPTFDAIIFTSAKQDALTAGGILPRHQAQRTLQGIFQEISRTLDRSDILRTLPEEQSQRVRDSLARQKTLLIVDNLETIEDKQGILSFLYELPANVKVVITTRERQSITPIRLTELPKLQGLQLIKQNADEMCIELTEDQATALYEATGGIPVAIVYAIGQIASGYTVQTVLERVKSAVGDVARFCFQGSVEPLRETPAHHLLMAIAMFPKNPVRDAVATVAGHEADPIILEEGLVKLQRLSLVTQVEERYSLLPLTREYALAELATHKNFEKEARKRWVEWYKSFVQEYGKYTWQEEWHIQYDKLEHEWENIQEVLAWCAEQERYMIFRNLWGMVERFTDLYGYWNDRLTWSDWLLQASERRGDLATLMDRLSDKGWMLQEMGQLEEATSCYDRAWKLREHNKDVETSLKLLKGIADNRIRRNLYDEALEWVNRLEQKVNNLPIAEEREHEEISVIFRRARIFHKTGNYDLAEELFQLVRNKSQLMGWQRSVIFSQMSLANINTAKGNFDQAESLLQTGLPEAIRNKDKRGIVFYKRSLARLAQKRGNIEEMRHWAHEAGDDFDRLGMFSYADEMRELLK